MEKKIALITGATSGIGEACARKFAAGGYDLIITGRNAEKLNQLHDQFAQMGTDVLVLNFDVRDREAAKKAIDSLSGKKAESWHCVHAVPDVCPAIAGQGI